MSLFVKGEGELMKKKKEIGSIGRSYFGGYF